MKIVRNLNGRNYEFELTAMEMFTASNELKHADYDNLLNVFMTRKNKRIAMDINAMNEFKSTFWEVWNSWDSDEDIQIMEAAYNQFINTYN